MASIDIGTNTVRCLVGRVEESTLQVELVRREIVRLGSGLRVGGGLRSGPVSRLMEVLTSFGALVRELHCRRVWVVGTSALRDVGSRSRVMEEAQAALGLPIDVISGEQEAALTASGVRAGIGDFIDGLVVDIGGGSTELIRVSGAGIDWWTSIPEGVVHLTEELLLDDPPTRAQTGALERRWKGLLLREPEDAGIRLAGTAGTPTTLAALDLGIDEYDPSLVNGHVLSRSRIALLRRALLGVDAAGRLRFPGMEKGREDLIVAGVIMIEEIMKRWNFQSMIVSDWGLLEGVALEAARGRGSEVPVPTG
ncbi:MAG: exopolyphosphatase [bacterium]|nr:MAG: exopolyphosphatase [bacterium]